MSSSRLVSIVIPAYKATFFETALASAISQNHDDVEIVICDDCPTEAIKNIVDKLSPGSRWPIRYERNPVGLGEEHNGARAISLARGQFIKFLYDDDILVPDCVRLLFDVLHDSPDIKMVCATRKLVDDKGQFMQDNMATRNPFGRNVVINGPELVSFIAQYPINFIGEPSSVMFRREDALVFGNEIMSLKGIFIWGLADVALFVKLLRQGNLAMLARPLSYFRVSDQQSSEVCRTNPELPRQRRADYHRITRELGWVRPEEQNRTVKIAPLSQRDNIQELDLVAYFDRRPENQRRNQQVASWLGTRRPTVPQQTLIRQHLQDHGGGPTIAIVVSDFNQQPESVLATVQSLASDPQLLDKLKVFILADYDTSNQTPLQAQLPWLSATEQDRAIVINDLMAENEHDWWVLVDAGTTFTQSGLLSAALKLIDAPHACALFGDEIALENQDGASLGLRPEFSLDYLLASPSATSRNWLFSREKTLLVGGFNPDHAQAIELDLILRMIEHPDFTEFAHATEPLVLAPQARPQYNNDEIRTLQRHLFARGYGDSEIQTTESGHYRITYGHAEQPLVSIIVSSNDQLETLLPCVESVLENTAYPNYEILISDNNSQSAQSIEWLANIDSLQSDKIRVVRHQQTLNPSALLNSAAQQAQGQYLLLLADNAAILHKDWLHNLLNQAQRPEVGVVGAKILAADGSLANAGIIVGLQDTAQPVTGGEPAASASFAQRLETEQNYSAVSGACLMIRKSLFDDIQGLEEHLFYQYFSDVDLCLRVRDAQHLVVWTPHTVIQLRSAPQAIDAEAMDFARRALHHRWLHYMAWDPAYNTNLTLQAGSFVSQDNPQLAWRPLIHRPLPVVLVQPDGLHAGTRIAQPLQLLGTALAVDGVLSNNPLSLPEVARLSPDTVVLQGSITASQIEAIGSIKEHTNAWVTFDLPQYPTGLESASSLRSALELVDAVTVPTQALADLVRDAHPNIQVIPTRLSPDIWLNVQSQRKTRDKPRIGWVGTADQQADLLILSGVIEALADKVEWVIMGPCSRWLRPYIHELRSPVEGVLYPELLASLNLDLVLVPAQSSLSTQSKSPVSLLEFGACGYPVICSDTLCTEGSLPVTAVSNETPAWIAAIEAHINQPDECARLGDELRREVRENWMLDTTNLRDWQAVWARPQ
ncbi:glycosyltransferase [Pseudomonas cichorii]|uniref:Glycosyl transferase n=1 Tax=Pseudomonas cichorii TaxID=36746 RepID=A0ABQ1DP32_PSECI|nr:glycosyltransferase [Pseudomonas cichorii]AHF68542.1 glycosyl transferase, group 2 family protein [Pseudomonas cichorii JBC1]QVE15546.1 glycosyltransferase [Pseudomonas cichorii]GFM92781.1 glycosyl transferase [Pseudomonas cichorii]SDO14485.1 Glycosyltransferase, GT2 family [Pseudomonas cichorii]